ncbi:strigolactone esterase D14 isoform X1 [Typha angustifolia]|uniref:strigolactone esterase D14 isoform X1 n=1 Tax=Typha angustifolia TaxID=59011 RepID=UPI003C2DC82E
MTMAMAMNMKMSMIRNTRMIGSGEKTLVLSHGYGGSQAVWEKVIPFLSERYQLLLFDWDFSGSGSGLVLYPSNYSLAAFADDLVSLVDEMGLKATIFVGHSMAGMIGCIASIKRPDLFRHLVLIGASPRLFWYLNTEDYEGGFEREEVDNLFSYIQSDFHAWGKSFVALAVGVNDPNSVEILGKSFHNMRPEVALMVARSIFLSDNRDILDKVEVSCTIIQVANDFAVPLSVGHYMQSKMKANASLEIIESDGHLPQLTAHHMLLAILDKVLII